MSTSYRIAIVGAASIRGKQLNEALSESSFAAAEFVLMDDPQALGKLEAVGDEITFIQPISASSFEALTTASPVSWPESTKRSSSARERMLSRDVEDWPIVATSLLLDLPRLD